MNKLSNMRKTRLILILLLGCWMLSAQTHIHITNPNEWTISELSPYVGQTVIFDNPMYLVSASTGMIAPHRIYSPTNQARPNSPEYYNICTLNNKCSVHLSGIKGSHRNGETIYQLTAKINSPTSIQWVSGTWRGNSRQDLIDHLPDVDIKGQHRLLVCAMNLEYYLVEDFDSISWSPKGPRDSIEHEKQQAKVSAALSRINADLYGIVEVQNCNKAMQELADDLDSLTGRNYLIIEEDGGCNGTYTKSSFIYDSAKLRPVSAIQAIDVGSIQNRMKMIAFEEISTGEKFIYSINHFKAKSGSGGGDDADLGDGQGSFNGTRVKEARAVISKYNKFKVALQETDVLFMGDLNAYGKEDPIVEFLSNNMLDLHRSFHADSSYSYTYREEVGYLDHAICNESLFPQVTGMAAYHINSDEDDSYTYSRSNDLTMFRSSDHDPVLVGLCLDSTLTYKSDVAINSINVYRGESSITINNILQTDDPNAKSFYAIYTIDGRLLEQQPITYSGQSFATPAHAGVYIVMVYDGGKVHNFRIIVP